MRVTQVPLGAAVHVRLGRAMHASLKIVIGQQGATKQVLISRVAHREHYSGHS